MRLLAVYVAFVLMGDTGAYLVGRTMEQFLSQSVSLAIFLGCFFVVFWLAWILAVRVTKPRAA